MTKGRRARALKKDDVMIVSTGSKELFSPRLRKAVCLVSTFDFFDSLNNDINNNDNNNNNNNNNDNNNNKKHIVITNCSHAKDETTLSDFDEEKESSIHSANASNLNLVSNTPTRESTLVQEQDKQSRKAFEFCFFYPYTFIFGDCGGSLHPVHCVKYKQKYIQCH